MDNLYYIISKTVYKIRLRLHNSPRMSLVIRLNRCNIHSAHEYAALFHGAIPLKKTGITDLPACYSLGFMFTILLGVVPRTEYRQNQTPSPHLPAPALQILPASAVLPAEPLHSSIGLAFSYHWRQSAWCTGPCLPCPSIFQFRYGLRYRLGRLSSDIPRRPQRVSRTFLRCAIRFFLACYPPCLSMFPWLPLKNWLLHCHLADTAFPGLCPDCR